MRRMLYIAVVVAGMTSLGIEMAASRLLGNVFGTSNLVWASIIGLILIYLAAGYFIGGRWADRHPYPQTFYQILIWSGVSTAVIPWISRPVLRLAANAFDALQFGVLGGSLVAVVILLCVPMILLGTASPFAIRLAIQDTQAAGRISGRIYALSTLGSFVGTFLPVLLLIPTIGTYRTFLVFSLGLILMGMIGLGYSSGLRKMLIYLWAPLLVAGIWIFGLQGTDKSSKGMIYEGESAYNYIQVIEIDGFRHLRLNEGQGTHSVYKEGVENYHGPWEQVLVAPFFYPSPVDPASIKSMAIVGLAAGTTARQATLVFGPIAIDGIEIDPKIVDIGRKYFDMNMPNLNVIVQDGRWGLEHSQKRYDIISVDAYRPPYIPWHLTTREFFMVVREHLVENGTLVINVGRSPSDRRLINSLATTMSGIFPSIHVVDVPYSFNSILFATVQPTDENDLIRNLFWLKENAKGHPLLIESMETAALNLQPAPDEGIVFTDDKAPVEWITNQMILDFIFSDEMETLQ
jgi:spermidine synthase